MRDCMASIPTHRSFNMCMENPLIEHSHNKIFKEHIMVNMRARQAKNLESILTNFWAWISYTYELLSSSHQYHYITNTRIMVMYIAHSTLLWSSSCNNLLVHDFHLLLEYWILCWYVAWLILENRIACYIFIALLEILIFKILGSLRPPKLETLHLNDTCNFVYGQSFVIVWCREQQYTYQY